MSLPFKALQVAPVPDGVRLQSPGFLAASQVTLASPARDVMTDFTQVTAVGVEPEMSIDTAEERMKHAQVRLLFVQDAQRNLLGLITLNDIKGERPMRYQREMGVSHRDILVRDIMTPGDRLEAIDMKDVEDARVGDILQTLKRTGRQHALVVERTSAGAMIRGLFSATRIGKQLGMRIDTSGIAYTFAELEAALTH